MPCGAAVLRGGISFIDNKEGGMGKIVPMRKRFGLPIEGLNTFITDTCWYCWCASCVATQEYRQVMALLDLGPVQEEDNTPPIVAGAIVGTTIVGEPVAANNA